MSNILTANDDTFTAEVRESDIPVLVDFWAEWCGPCKQLNPVIAELADEYAGRVKFVKVDADAAPETAMACQVQGLPTLLIFDGGEIKANLRGAMTKGAISKALDAHLEG